MKKAGRTQNRKRRMTLVFVLLFLVFLSVLDYPFVARLYNESRQNGAAVSFQEGETAVPDAEKEQMLQAAREYNTRLASGTGMSLESAFGGEQEELSGSEDSEEKQLHDEYESLLNSQGDGVMGRLEIPKIGVDLLIYHGTADEELQKGAGHLEGSSLPVGGEGTHVCLSAHRGLPGKKLFTSLDEMEEGDIFFLHVLGETLCYRVGEITTVLPEDTEELVIESGKDLVTLITCTPYGINTHRLCVEGYRIPYTEEVLQEAAAQAESSRLWLFLQDWGWIPVSLVLIAVMCIMLWRYNRK